MSLLSPGQVAWPGSGPLQPGSRNILAAAIFASGAASALVANLAERPITAAIVFLVAVVFVGGLKGAGGGLIAGSGASVLYNVFLSQPRFRLSLNSLEDLVPLVAFTCGAVATGMLTGRLKDRADAAERARRGIVSLFALSEQLQAAVNLEDVARAVSVFDGGSIPTDYELYSIQGQSLRPVQSDSFANLAEELISGGTSVRRSGDLEAHLLTAAAVPVGVLVMHRDEAAGNPGDEDVGALVNLVSITVERCLLLERLSRAELVRRSEEFKTALLASVSHDMRTPLSAISAAAGSLSDYSDTLDENARLEMTRIIVEQCSRLDRYTANLLDLGRLQGGIDPIRFTGCDALDVLAAAIVRLRGIAPERSIGKRFEVGSAIVRADPVMLEQVFNNVLENAVRYGDPSRPIHVGAARSSSHLVVTFRDFGPGISPTERERVFERFYRTTATRGYEGNGLGLSIARGFVEAFGGTIQIDEPADDAGGTLVRISLPLQMPRSDAA